MNLSQITHFPKPRALNVFENMVPFVVLAEATLYMDLLLFTDPFYDNVAGFFQHLQIPLALVKITWISLDLKDSYNSRA